MLRLKKPVVFLDFETTGTNVAEDKIVQIAMLKVHPSGEKEVKKTLVNPGKPIPPGATKVHGITDEMVENSPSFKQLSKGILAFIAGCDLAGYNSDRFDIPLLMEELDRVGVSWPEPGEDLVTIDCYLFEKHLNSHTLEATYLRRTGKKLEGAHDAMSDVEGTFEVLFRQLDEVGEKSPEEIAQLYRGDDNRIDFAGKMILIEDVPCWSFGKNQGKPVLDDKQYCDWVLRADFAAETKNKLKAILNEQE